jgi:murein DD-endopeptidase MepM/ murein hydrolase activator NlpD
LLKPETTQKVKLVHTLNTHQHLLTSQSSAREIEKRSGFAKVAALLGNHRSRTSAVMLGLTVLMGLFSFPPNYVDTVAAATESAAKSIQSGSEFQNFSVTSSTKDRYIDQLRHDLSGMRAQYPRQSAVLVAQSMPLRGSPLPVATRTETNPLQFTGETSVPIEVAQPKTKTFKPVPAGQAYYGSNGSEGESKDYEDRSPTVQTGTTTIGFSWPATGKLTSRYGRRWGRMHKGIDIAGPVGTPINAAADGTIISAGWNSGGYGNLVEVRHSDGTTTRYGHNSRLSVSVGQTVRQGQQVAEMGSTGHSTGSHLHFEIRPSGGAAVNPISHLPANS